MNALRHGFEGRAGWPAGMSHLRGYFLLATVLAASATAFLLGGAPAAVSLLGVAVVCWRLHLRRQRPAERALAAMPARVNPWSLNGSPPNGVGGNPTG